MLTVTVLPATVVLLLGVLFAADARDRAAEEHQRRAHAVLCSGKDCDIAPSAE